MLIIRQAQMDEFEKVSLGRLEDMLVSEIAVRFPDQATSEKELRARVRWGIARAEAHDIESEADISSFVFLMMEFGDRFEERTDLPFVTNVLRDEHMHGAAKMPAVAARRESLRRRKERASNESV